MTSGQGTAKNQLPLFFMRSNAMDKRGLTLLELVLAMALISVIGLAGGTLLLSSMKTTMVAQSDNRMQNELLYVFRDMEKNLQDTRVNALLDWNDELSPAFVRKGSAIWIGTVNFREPVNEEVWYGYYPSGGVLERWICPKQASGKIDYGASSGDCSITTISRGVLAPYAEADLNADGVVDANEKSARDTCLADPLISANCENNASYRIYPVFKVSSDKKQILISFKGVTQGALGGKKNLSTAGMTKAIYLQASPE